MTTSSYWGLLNLPKEIIFDSISYMVNGAGKACSTTATSSVSAPKMDYSVIVNRFNASPWVKVAALAGAAAVAFGAYGAHGLKNPDKRVIYETANKYHFYHSVALLATPFMRKPNLVGSLFLGGILIFSGTCYCNAITDNNQVVQYTPVGGFMFILGWLAILL